ncbi:MAG: Cysteine desulfurase [Phycisphaerae bacterium]|nr:Cysteine desulfurase [Phycisphaerae bacterium]
MPKMDWWARQRELFPIARNWAFLNHAAVGPLCPPAADALRAYAYAAESESYLGGQLYSRCQEARSAVATLIHGESLDTVAFVKNTSEGMAQVAEGLDWTDGANIVTAAGEFPANVYPWLALGKRGVELRRVQPVESGGCLRVPTEKLLAACDGRTALITLSAVQYGTGQAADLSAIGRFARERGILFCVDAIQQLGCRPLDVQACRIDFLSADGHKWLLGPEGAGLFYCRRELLERLRPLVHGWMNVVGAQDYGRADATLRSDARRFEPGSWNVPGLWALGASVAMFNELGMERVWSRVESLTDRLAEGLADRGHTVISPRSAGEKSGIVSFLPAQGQADEALVRRLAGRKIVIALRDGRLRASPHFYNSEQEIDSLIGALEGDER